MLCVPAFRDLYDELCAELLAELPTTYEMPQEAVDWIKEVCSFGALLRAVGVRADTVGCG